MPNVSIDDLIPGSMLKEDLYHIESGLVLMKRGEMLLEEKLEILEEMGIEQIFKGGSQAEVNDFLHGVKYNSITLDNSSIGKSFEAPLYDKMGRILIEQSVPINDSLLKLIIKGGGVVYQTKEKDTEAAALVDEFYQKVSKLSLDGGGEAEITTLDKAEIAETEYDFDLADLLPEDLEINSDFVDQDLAKRKKPKSVEIVPDAVLLEMAVKDPLAKRTEEYKNTFNDAYVGLVQDLEILFKNICENSSGNIESHVKSITSRIINTLIADKNLVINLTNMRSPRFDYVVQHSLNVTVYAINIGCALGYSEKQVYELAFGALLADIGMLKVPLAIREKKAELNADERRELQRHPGHSLDLLNNIKGIPNTLPYIIYQSHERLDASGYPKGRPSFLIHDYAKIIAISDTFDSLCSLRPWRDGKIPYKAMEEVILQAGKKRLDGKIIRQWLFSISLFPVGSYVTLSDTSVSKVISANPTDFSRPNVRVINRSGDPLEEPETLVLGDKKDLKITHAINENEANASILDGF